MKVDFSVGIGLVSALDVGLHVTTDFVVATGDAGFPLENFLAFVDDDDLSLAGMNFEGERASEPVVVIKSDDGKVIASDEEVFSFEPNHEEVIGGVVDLGTDEMRFGFGDAGDSEFRFEAMNVVALSGPNRFVSVCGHFTKFAAWVFRILSGRSAAGGAHDDGSHDGVIVEDGALGIGGKFGLGDLIG